MAKMLLGIPPNKTGSVDDGCFHEHHGSDPTTKNSCAKIGYWLGNETDSAKFTIIDTPGLGDEANEDQQTIDNLANFLKEDMKFIHVFVLTFDLRVRWTAHMREQFRLFETMFGEDLWNNAILLGTHWSKRYADQQGITEEARTKDLNKKLSKSLDMVFFDTFYDRHDQDQVEKFKENTEKLWNMAKTVTPFDCKDVQAAKLRIKELLNEIDRMREEIDELENPPTVPLWAWAGIGFFVLGVVIALIIFCCCRSCMERCCPVQVCIHFCFDKLT